MGFRPFVLSLAKGLGLSGMVRNLGSTVVLEAAGDETAVGRLIATLEQGGPPGSLILSIAVEELPADAVQALCHQADFRISESEKQKETSLPILPPDIGICPSCRRELLEEGNRRKHYPLISCAGCGPRYSILRALPYDRAQTAMTAYDMCESCASEYAGLQPDGRRHHAQTISCHQCGPQMVLIRPGERAQVAGTDGEQQAIRILREGGILGVKGIGGYQLVVRADHREGVQRLRVLKGRETKPFAVLFPDAESIRKLCRMSGAEEQLLTDSARPIVLLDLLPGIHIPFPPQVFGDNTRLGVMLPSFGAYVLLAGALGPLIVTSANISDTPMLTDDQAFLRTFLENKACPGGPVDGVWMHDRPILRPQDDSVMQVVPPYGPLYLRRGRGSAPLPVMCVAPQDVTARETGTVLALGGDLKNTFAVGRGDRIVLSAPFGDLFEAGCMDAERKEVTALCGLLQVETDGLQLVCDRHPGYASTQEAETLARAWERPAPLRIQHHHAHIASVMAEMGWRHCIGAAFDGTGYGDGGQIWGSEVLYCTGTDWRRCAHLAEIPLVGGDETARTPARTAACFLLHAGQPVPASLCTAEETDLITAALRAGIGTSMQTSMGRLFDAIAALCGLGRENRYEGECAMRLQQAAEQYLLETAGDTAPLPLPVYTDERRDERIWDSDALIRAATEWTDPGQLAAAFHRAIAHALTQTCCALRQELGENRVALSGGVFQNRLLLALATEELTARGFVVATNRMAPPGDGGLSLGQAWLALESHTSL
ncbi:MAG: carbamoyltransferase HypF [Butyrivibrio sp.]|nr:carbamoyltransferase HypF [Butyrivibrio sp.]